MAAVVEEIPVVDFSPYGLDRDTQDPETINQLVDDVYQALTTLGFLYLKNYGIPPEKVEKAFDVSRKFFDLSLDKKMPYHVKRDGVYGYRPMESESLSTARKYKDVKEAFSFSTYTNGMPFPDKDVPDFESTFSDLFNDLMVLEERLLEVIAMGLKLEDPKHFVKKSKLGGTPQNQTSMVSFYYPPLTNREIKGDQVRCMEHQDFANMTLLMQDMEGGLEVKTRQGKWIEATPMKDTILANSGCLLQRWTSDRVIACEHKVLLPVDEIKRNRSRQSIAFFGCPDDEAMIECADKSNMYPPIKTRDYLEMRYSAMLGYI